jgi:hypothetical protein
MNKVDFLLNNPFHKSNDLEKLTVKQLGPDHPSSTMIQKHKTQSLSFNPDWYKSKPCITASENKKTLFCFNCLLFGGDISLTLNGVSDLKHLLQRIKYHELSSSHVGNSLTLDLCGKVDVRSQIDEKHRIAVAHHNELVHENRHNLSRVIDCLIFCGSHKISLQGHDEIEKNIKQKSVLRLVK